MYVDKEVQSEELQEEAKRVRQSILEYITSTEISKLGQPNLDETPMAVKRPRVEIEGDEGEKDEEILSQDHSSELSDHSDINEEEEKSSSSSFITSSSSSSSEDDEIISIPLKKQKCLNEEHDSAVEEIFDTPQKDEENEKTVVQQIKEL